MKPIGMQLGRYYWTTTCATPGCGEKLVLQEVDRDAPFEDRERQKGSLAGERVRCSSCVQETVIEIRKLIFTECR